MMANPKPQNQQVRDESPFPDELRRYLPSWLRKYLPAGGGDHLREEEKTLFGFLSFLISESFIFLSFILSTIALRTTTTQWLPTGVESPQITIENIISSVILLSSSIVIYFAERALNKNKLAQFRLLWLLVILMGSFFLYAEIKEWLDNSFGPASGLMGSTYYLLTGFHGLHVAAGIILLCIMLIRSFIPHIYRDGHYGVTAISIFWHFVDVVWIIVFSLVYLW